MCKAVSIGHVFHNNDWNLYAKHHDTNDTYRTTTLVVNQAWRKQFRVGPAKIGSNADGASTLGGSGGMHPQKILKFSFSKMRIWRILREN